MDDSTKDRAKEKARAMVEHIGYPSGKWKRNGFVLH